MDLQHRYRPCQWAAEMDVTTAVHIHGQAKPVTCYTHITHLYLGHIEATYGPGNVELHLNWPPQLLETKGWAINDYDSIQ